MDARSLVANAVADGKVITLLFRAEPGDKKIDKRTGEVHYPRAEHDAALHVEGTGEMVWGTKYVLIAARHPQPHSRYIVDVAHVPTSGAEAGVAVDRFTQLAPLLSGAQGVVYDTALRGTHHQRLTPSVFTPTARIGSGSSIGQRTSVRSRRAIRISRRCTSGATMPRASTATSTTRSGSDERTASAGGGSC